jgi:enoyl-CoA hydratase/carnithine racemase
MTVAAAGTVLRVSDDDGVRVLTLDRPEARNAFNVELYDAVRRALQAASADGDIGAVLITGAGEIFSAGEDLKEGKPSDLGRGFVPFAKTLASFDKPLIAAVNGPAVGVGVTMLLHCDLVLVSEAARLCTPFVKLGIVPEAASSLLLPARIGPQAAAHMLFTGQWVTAEESVATGHLLEQSQAVATAIAKMPMDAVMATKQLLLAARSDAVTAAFDRELGELVRLLSQGRFASDSPA